MHLCLQLALRLCLVASVTSTLYVLLYVSASSRGLGRDVLRVACRLYVWLYVSGASRGLGRDLDVLRVAYRLSGRDVLRVAYRLYVWLYVCGASRRLPLRVP